MALFNRAIRAICFRCSLKKERKDQFALLKRAKERFALFCQTMSDFHEKQRANSQPCFCVCHIIGFVAFCVCAVLWGLSLIVFVSPYGVYQLSLIGFVALQYLLLGLSLIGFVTLWGQLCYEVCYIMGCAAYQGGQSLMVFVVVSKKVFLTYY